MTMNNSTTSTTAQEVYITMNDLTAMLKVSRTGILGLIRKGILPQGIKLGKIKRWPLSTVQECLQRL